MGILVLLLEKETIIAIICENLHKLETQIHSPATFEQEVALYPMAQANKSVYNHQYAHRAFHTTFGCPILVPQDPPLF